MTRLDWDAQGSRFYEVGVDRGVLYVNNVGVSWSGLISVSQKSSGGDPQPFYLDGFKYINLASSEEFEATIEALSAPKEFGVCDGTVQTLNGLYITGQRRQPFNLCYRTLVGNDTDGSDHGYKIHLVYNALAAPSDRNNQTLTDNAQPLGLSWDITTTPPDSSGYGYKPTAHFIVDSTVTDPSLLTILEGTLYGEDESDPTFPTIYDILALFS